MVGATLKRGRSKVVDKSSVDQISSLLKELPKKEKQEIPISDAIAGIADTIKEALAKGYSYDELSQMLSDKLGIGVSVWSLRRYLNIATKAPEKPKTRRGRKAKAEASAAAAAIEAPTATVAVEPEAPAPDPVLASEPVPAKQRRTRTTKPKAEAPAPKKTGTRTKAAAAPKGDDAPKTTTRRSRTAAPKATGTRSRKKA